MEEKVSEVKTPKTKKEADKKVTTKKVAEKKTATSKKITNKENGNVRKTTTPDVKKLKLLITIVNRSRALLYLDVIEQFEVNMQMVIYGKGTASSEIINLLGLSESDKAVILSVIKEDKVKDALETLKEKFEKVKHGKGVACTVPLSSVVGVSIYQFLSNNQVSKKEDKNNG